MPISETIPLDRGATVRHAAYGQGEVIVDAGPTAVVRFLQAIHEVPKSDLDAVGDLATRLGAAEWDVPVEAINRIQAEAIRSIHQEWGVFSASRIELLPHQLWVCRQVNSTWPARWLVADDVGLGKSVEAGMVLSPLLSSRRVRRLLVLCPAALVPQWQNRMYDMFRIPLTTYTTAADNERSRFWEIQDYVVASFHTLKLDNRGRQQRLLRSEPFDMVVVDEAHHLSSNEREGATLGYRLLREMEAARRIRSMVFFTGTPHRGKDFDFLSLLNLLRPEFDPRRPLREQLSRLPEVMIRNNKATVTDLNGNRLFRSPRVESATFSFSPEEARFYAMLTEFIARGEAYAGGLSSRDNAAVMMVLVAMQKLASSSVAAIRRAIERRLARVQASRDTAASLQGEYDRLRSEGDSDALAALEERLAPELVAVRLMENEEPALRSLLGAADRVTEETKVRILLGELEQRYRDRSVLFFTEYKATQSLLMSALIARYGPESVTFINGDGRAEGVAYPGGQTRAVVEDRAEAARRFNAGQVRFLIATEAAGEGIDLQENCHTLVHVDLPWNPMRMHQRVGRLNRYGQRERVEVLVVHNPDTVESLIWSRLEEKLESINAALCEVMEEPEDMRELVLGMGGEGLFAGLVRRASRVPRERLDQWFDQETRQFGGEDAFQAVRDLVGNSSRFDFGQASRHLPRVDLEDLRPFFELSLFLNGRRVQSQDGSESGKGTLSFKTPDAWRDDPEWGISLRAEYADVSFSRRAGGGARATSPPLGVGTPLVDAALEQALARDAAVALVPREVTPDPLCLFRVRDRVTTGSGSPGAFPFVVGVLLTEGGANAALLRDWQVLQLLGDVPYRRPALARRGSDADRAFQVRGAIDRAEAALGAALGAEVPHRMRYPSIEFVALLWPEATALPGD